MIPDKRKIIILVFLIVAALALWIRGLTVKIAPPARYVSEAPGGTGRDDPVAARLARQWNASQRTGGNPGPPSRAMDTFVESSASLPKAGRPFKDWDRNPFMLRRELSLGGEGLALGGILWDPQNPLAVINDEVLGVGEEVNGLRVIKISETEVLLEDDGREFTLKLASE